MSIQRRRLLALIEYAQQSVQSRTRVVSNVADHGRFLLFDHQLGGVDGTQVDRQESARHGSAWLAVARPAAPELPPRPENAWLAPWLGVGEALLVAPRLAPEIAGSALIAAGTHRDGAQPPKSVAEMAMPVALPQATHTLATYPFLAEVETQFARYLESAWRPWADAERRRRRHARLYMWLMTLEQELSGAMGDGGIELVWGFAIGVRRHGDQAQAYPLLTQAVDLRFHAATGTAEITPRSNDPRIELDAFDPAENPALAALEAEVRREIQSSHGDLSPFTPDAFLALAERFRPVLDPAAAERPEPEQLRFTPGWVLFARPRGGGAVVEDLDRFAEQLAGHDDIRLPPAVAALVTEPSSDRPASMLPRYRGLSGEGGAAAPDAVGKPRDLCLPKPYNDEQVRIVQLLDMHDGVAVQGPPGTGKTHTIANLICHCLAQGQRVLVTSMKDPALTVLREQLPAPLRPLAITLLGEEQAESEQFETAIEVIAKEVQSIDPESVGEHVERLGFRLDALHARLAEIDATLLRLARRELDPIVLDGEAVPTTHAAESVAQALGTFEWIPDMLGTGAEFRPQFTVADIAAMYEARERIGDSLDHVGHVLPDPDSFPSGTTLLRIHHDLLRLGAAARPETSVDGPVLADPGPEIVPRLRALSETVARVWALRREILREGDQWAPRLLGWIKAGSHGETFRMLEALGGDLEDATAARQAFMARPVTAPEGADRDAHLREATDKLAQGRRAFGLAGVFFNAEAKHRLASLEVEGQAPSGADAWKHVSDYLAYQQRWRALALRWNAMAPEFGFTVLATDDPEQGTQAAAQYARYRSVRALAEAETVLERETLALFPTWTRARRVADDGQALSSLETALQRYLDTYGLSEFWSARELLERRLAGCSGPVVSRIRRFLGERLGRQSVDESAFLAEWSTLMAEVGRVRSLGPALETVVRVAAAIERSGAPELARLLRNPGPLHDRLLPAPDQWPMAWRLRRLDTYLSAVNVQAEFQRLGFLRAELEHDLARHYQEFAVTRTWLEMARNTSPAIRAALQAYLNAIQRLGKGTGKRAARYRRDAREAAVEAQRAIPCWIMPHHRVSETLPAQLGAFDLVIIDEASQSDLTALPALLRARKLLVVGDDRQVSPEGIGLEEKRIVQLMERHLADQVPLYRAQLSPDRSLYDLARVVFAGAGIMLKEHFRSVAPIVEYSKREFYGHQLQPLRLPKANERLDPPLVDIHIPEGERHGDTNPAEIDAIVGEIGRLIADPQMADRTIGVVSLLGDEQALRIWERLLERHPPELLRRHAVTCGDARTFQGRERDIIFLSMVVAPNTAIAPLTRDVFLQRFNVAASRARDRMVLVRSVEPFQLSESDRLRRGLIAHFMQPFAEAAPVTDPRDQCESPLERALYDWLVMKGYRVQPQVRLGSFGIDLVVEGSNGARLAIACDGDRGEDPALWLQDLRRQRTLERVGWVFWRCFASVWACRPESVLRSLEAVLRTHAVEPGESGGALSASLVEHRVVRRNPGADPTVDRAAVIARGSPVLRPVPSGAPTTASGAASSPVPGLVLVPSPSPLAPST